jgi:transcriptional regulator with XRE-family HTH domain
MQGSETKTQGCDELRIIGERIRVARALASLSQIQLAEMTGMSEMSLIRYESGERPIGAHLLLRVAKVTGVSIAWLYGYSAEDASMRSLAASIERLFSQCNQQQIRFCYNQMESTVRNVLENF